LEIALFVLGLLLGLDFDTYDAAFSSEMLSEVEKYDVLVKNFQQETGLRMVRKSVCPHVKLLLALSFS